MVQKIRMVEATIEANPPHPTNPIAFRGNLTRSDDDVVLSTTMSGELSREQTLEQRTNGKRRCYRAEFSVAEKGG
jgi:hypothetical protein